MLLFTCWNQSTTSNQNKQAALPQHHAADSFVLLLHCHPVVHHMTRRCGCSEVILYTQEDVVERVQQITGGKGVKVMRGELLRTTDTV